MHSAHFMVTLVLAYLIGSLNGAIIICKIMQLPSPRSVGSGNPGATNVIRLGNKTAAILTLLFDVFKGIVAVLIALWFHLPALYIGLAGFVVVFGHMYPLFFGFKGGKGVATSLGVICTINLMLGACVILSFMIMLALFRYVSLASIISALLCPVIGYFLVSHAYTPSLILIALFITFRHHENIKRLFNGNENKLGQKKQ